MTSTRTRCFRVEIESPPADAAKSIAYHRERVIEEDGEIIGKAKTQPDSIRLPFRDLATVVRTVTDPVTGQEVRCSAAAIAAWITADYEERNAADEAQVAAEKAAQDAAAKATTEKTADLA
jgi:hypothetical protein